MTIKKNQSGVAILEIILILVVVGIIGFTGWYVWQSKQNTEASLESANKVATGNQQATIKKDEAVSKTGLTKFISSGGVFTVEYPSSWVKPANPELCGEYLTWALEAGPDKKSVIKCGADGTNSQVSVYYSTTEKAGDPSLSLTLSGYTGYKEARVVTGQGISGTSYSAVAVGQAEGLGALPDGTIVVTDQFKKDNWVITATYTQYPSTENEGPTQDQRAAFDKIVKSISFD